MDKVVVPFWYRNFILQKLTDIQCVQEASSHRRNFLFQAGCSNKQQSAATLDKVHNWTRISMRSELTHLKWRRKKQFLHSWLKMSLVLHLTTFCERDMGTIPGWKAGVPLDMAPYLNTIFWRWWAGAVFWSISWSKTGGVDTQGGSDTHMHMVPIPDGQAACIVLLCRCRLKEELYTDWSSSIRLRAPNPQIYPPIAN